MKKQEPDQRKCFFFSVSLSLSLSISLYIYIYACNLIWWAVLGFQDVMKQQEIRRNKEKKTKKLKRKRPKTQQKTATILWRFLFAIFDYKTGDFLRFWPCLCPPIEVTAIYIYIYFFFCCKVKLVQDLGVFKLKTGPSLRLKTGPSLFLLFSPFLKCFGGMFINTNSVT